MKKLKFFIKVTFGGGILFLIPVVVMAIVVVKAIGFLRHLSAVIAEKIPYSHVAGVGVITLISILLLLILCFLAGIFMITSLAHKIVRRIEDKVLIYVPGYSYVHEMSNDKLSAEGTDWKPATIFVDENEVLCFVTDETGGYCSIFLPSAPNPSSRTVQAREKSQ